MVDEIRERDPVHPRVLLAGGGSAGHVFPALAIGDELARRGWRVSFAGNPAGMEAELVNARGIEFVPMAARPLVGRGAAARVRALETLARSARAARRWIHQQDVRAVVGTGGYASAPAVVGARWARRPALLVEPNARPGVANRWLSRFASVAAVAYEETGRELRCDCFVAGVPVREAFFDVPALPDEPVPRVLVLGGSQGSRRLNLLLPPTATRVLESVPGLTVVHQCGEKNLDETLELWKAEGEEVAARVEVVPFIDDVIAAVASASILVSRAGAITLAEICAAGRPSVLVPLALASGHQRENAGHLESRGAAEVLDEVEATPRALAEKLARLLSDSAALGEMARRARGLARPGAAAAIADRVESLAATAAEEKP